MSDSAPPPLVWLVDDDPDCLAIGRRTLERAGYRVMCFEGPDEALVNREEKPAAIVTDLMMDALDAGLSFAKRVREDPELAKVPIVVTTAIEQRLGLSIRPRGEEDLAAMKVDAFVPKPVIGPALREVLERLMRREDVR